jgi:hypothetical protein
MYFIIILILSFFSFLDFYFNKKYSVKILLTFSVGVLFFILLGFNSYSLDLDNYKLLYEDLDQDYMKLVIEPFIFYFMIFSKNIGLSFEGYQVLFSFLTFLLFSYSLFMYSPLPVFVFLNFFFIPFYPDIVQIRFFLGFVIFLFSIQFFDTKKWWFYSLLLIAILCHFSLLIILFFLFIKRFKFFKNQFKSNVIIITGICFLSFIPKSIIEPTLTILNPKYSLYVNTDELSTFLGTLVLFIPFFIINNIILWHYNNRYSENSIPIKYAKNVPIFIELVQFSNYTILFQYFIRDFSRISQNGLIIASIYFSIIIYSLIEQKKIFSAQLIVICTIMCTIIIYFIQFLMVNKFQYFEVINKTITTNLFFNFISNIFRF